jgi:hypothetical protein
MDVGRVERGRAPNTGTRKDTEVRLQAQFIF